MKLIRLFFALAAFCGGVAVAGFLEMLLVIPHEEFPYPRLGLSVVAMVVGFILSLLFTVLYLFRNEKYQKMKQEDQKFKSERYNKRGVAVVRARYETSTLEEIVPPEESESDEDPEDPNDSYDDSLEECEVRPRRPIRRRHLSLVPRRGETHR